MSREEIASSGEGLTRREMLKKSALVGAVAWAAPVVSSFSTPAFAQVSPPPTCTCDPADPCFGQTVCGEGCGCVPTVDGDCFCHQGSSCGALQACGSATDPPCPEGWACANSCCLVFLCLPPCGTFAAVGGEGPRSTPS